MILDRSARVLGFAMPFLRVVAGVIQIRPLLHVAAVDAASHVRRIPTGVALLEWLCFSSCVVDVLVGLGLAMLDFP